MALDNYRILVENEISAWDDETGVRYHFPKNRYFNRLKTGMRFIYYKGRTNSNKPRYFGYGEIANIYPDPESQSDYYADITNYIVFEKPLDFKPNGEYKISLLPIILDKTLLDQLARKDSIKY